MSEKGPSQPQPEKAASEWPKLVGRAEWENYVAENQPDETDGEVISLSLADDLDAAVDAAHQGQYPEADTLMDVLEISDQRVRESAAEFEDEIENIRNEQEEGIAIGIELGYLPANISYERFISSMEGTSLAVVDPELLHHDQGNYTFNNRLVAISREARNKSKTYVHETDHDASGGTYVEHKDGEVDRVRAGFSSDRVINEDLESLPGQGDIHHLALDEAIREHIAQSINHGMWDEMDPTARKDDGAYKLIRGIVARGISNSDGIVRLKAVTRANYEDTVPGGRFPDRRRMVRQFTEAFGPGALRRLDRLLNLAWESYDWGDPPEDELEEAIEYWSQFIGPKTYDDEGKVISGINLNQFDFPEDVADEVDEIDYDKEFSSIVEAYEAEHGLLDDDKEDALV